MDTFVEQLVVKPMTPADQAKKFGLIAATGILCLGLAYLSVMVMPLIPVSYTHLTLPTILRV